MKLEVNDITVGRVLTDLRTRQQMDPEAVSVLCVPDQNTATMITRIMRQLGPDVRCIIRSCPPNAGQVERLIETYTTEQDGDLLIVWWDR